MALIAGIGGFEWARLCGLGVLAARLYAAGIVAALALLAAIDFKLPVFMFAAIFWLLAVPAWLWLGVKSEHRSALAAVGFLVLVPPALAMIAFRPGEALLVLAVAWIADTAAYFAGRRWGRRKLAPSISPGKTWEGAAGGLIAAAAYAIIVSVVLAEGKGAMALVCAAALLVAVSIAGDLFESAAKRQAGVKDSGALLPGHGGMLDRIDSATATLPVAAAMVLLVRTSLS
jgi:phosphatidate cytidylyltransferase